MLELGAPATRVLASAERATDLPSWSFSASPTIARPSCLQLQGAVGAAVSIVGAIVGLEVAGDAEGLAVMWGVVGEIVGLKVVGDSEGSC